MWDDLKHGFGGFALLLAVTAILFFGIGRWIGFWWQDLIFIYPFWVFGGLVAVTLKVILEDHFDMIWPILPGAAWASLWWAIHHLAVEKAGFSGVFLDSSGNLPPYIELSWWSSPTFKGIVLVVLVGAGYAINYIRSNR